MGGLVFGRFGGWARLPSVVRGTGIGLYGSPMPGTLCVRGDGVWWIAEGSTEPVSVAGRAEPAPVHDASIPRELTVGVMRVPMTVRVRLDGGGWAELTVRRRSAELVRRAVNGRTGASGSAGAPPLRGRAPIGPHGLLILGIALTIVFGSVEPEGALERTIATVGGLAGLELARRGRRLAKRRAERVAATRHSRNEDNLVTPPAVGVAPAVRPDVVLTFEPMRVALSARCAEQAWDRKVRRDLHDWPRAVRHRVGWQVLACLIGGLLAVGLGVRVVELLADPPGWVGAVGQWLLVSYGVLVLVAGVGAWRYMVRARRVARQVPGISMRYLLARDCAESDHLILFPPFGDAAAVGVIELELSAAGAIPLAGTVELAGPIDPASRRPVDGELLVPLLDSRPLWPRGEYRAWSAEELRRLVAGRDPLSDQE